MNNFQRITLFGAFISIIVYGVFNLLTPGTKDATLKKNVPVIQNDTTLMKVTEIDKEEAFKKDLNLAKATLKHLCRYDSCKIEGADRNIAQYLSGMIMVRLGDENDKRIFHPDEFYIDYIYLINEFSFNATRKNPVEGSDLESYQISFIKDGTNNAYLSSVYNSPIKIVNTIISNRCSFYEENKTLLLRHFYPNAIKSDDAKFSTISRMTTGSPMDSCQITYTNSGSLVKEEVSANILSMSYEEFDNLKDKDAFCKTPASNLAKIRAIVDSIPEEDWDYPENPKVLSEATLYRTKSGSTITEKILENQLNDSNIKDAISDEDDCIVRDFNNNTYLYELELKRIILKMNETDLTKNEIANRINSKKSVLE